MVAIEQEKLKFSTKVAYGLGDFGPAFTANILVFYLLYFFTNVAGLSPSLAGSVLMLGKISDAINDPIVGAWSDRTKTKWGRRIPWILGGIIPFGLIFILQWVVPPFPNQWWLFAYYLAIGVVFNLAYTMVNLPYTALTPELTEDYDERTALNSFRFSFSIGGSIISLILVLLVAKILPDRPGEQFFWVGIISGLVSMVTLTLFTLRIKERGQSPLLTDAQKIIVGKVLAAAGGVGVAIAIVNFFSQGLTILTLVVGFMAFFLILGSYTLITAITENHLTQNAPSKEEPLEESSVPQLSMKEQLKIVFNNRPFLFIIGIYLSSWLAVQLTASILIYYVVDYMGMTNQDSALVSLAVQGTALAVLFGWQKFSQRFGKKAAYIAGSSLWLIAQGGLFLLQPGQGGLLFTIAIVAGFGVSVAYLIPWSMLPDVIELDELNTGQRREGIFYGFMVLLQKFGLALGLFIIGIALEAAGFIEAIPGEPLPLQPESAINAIRYAIAPIPACCLLLGIVLAYFYPITKELHGEIRLKLLAQRQGHHKP